MTSNTIIAADNGQVRYIIRRKVNAYAEIIRSGGLCNIAAFRNVVVCIRDAVVAASSNACTKSTRPSNRLWRIRTIVISAREASPRNMLLSAIR
jgi:hypothetical protein